MTWIAFIGGWAGIAIVCALAFCWITDTDHSNLPDEENNDE